MKTKQTNYFYLRREEYNHLKSSFQTGISVPTEFSDLHIKEILSELYDKYDPSYTEIRNYLTSPITCNLDMIVQRHKVRELMDLWNEYHNRFEIEAGVNPRTTYPMEKNISSFGKMLTFSELVNKMNTIIDNMEHESHMLATRGVIAHLLSDVGFTIDMSVIDHIIYPKEDESDYVPTDYLIITGDRF